MSKRLSYRQRKRQIAISDDTLLPFDLPADRGKQRTSDFESDRVSSHIGAVLLREVGRGLGLAVTLAGCTRDRLEHSLVVDRLSAMLRFSRFATTCGDACPWAGEVGPGGGIRNSDALRTDPLLKPTVGHAPESDRALCSQPTMSWLENTPARLETARMTAAPVDLFCRSFPAPPATVALDNDHTCDPVHGHQ